MNIIIRKAVQQDCERMMELIHELAAYEKAPDQVTVDINHFVESGFGEKPVWWSYVAELTHKDQSKEIAGFALYYIRYSTWKGQRMYLEEIIVTEKFRNKGIGTMLFDELIIISKEMKFKGINWQVLDWNEPAINFYKKFSSVKFDSEWINCSIDNI